MKSTLHGVLTESSHHNPEVESNCISSCEVEFLPFRRVLSQNGRLRDSLLLLSEFAPNETLLLRIKHVALDFTADFGTLGTVPGSRFIGVIARRNPITCVGRTFGPNDNLFVFPYSPCWVQNGNVACDNCIRVESGDTDDYATHCRMPCSRPLIYGKSAHGGLQDFIRVPSPAHTLVKVPDSVSLHDCCFLLQVAVPFLSFCVDALAEVLILDPQRVLIVLDDVAKETNDCLLVIRHLRLDPSLFTLTDAGMLAKSPQLYEKYRGKFPHVLVFAHGEESVKAAIWLCPTDQKAGSRKTLALFRNQKPGFVPRDRTLYRVSLSYKDKFLMEQLLATIASLNETHREMGDPFSGTFQVSTNTAKNYGDFPVSGHNSDTYSFHPAATHNLDNSPRTSVASGCNEKKPEKSVHFPKQHNLRHTSWLHCDRDLNLCTCENSVHNAQRPCHQTRHINEMLASKCPLTRVFYTRRSAAHVKLNVLML